MTNKNSRGSITVEASLSMILFVFFMVCIISLINISRVQTKVGNALHLAAIDISNMSYLYYLVGLYDLDTTISNSGEDAGTAITGHLAKADTVIKDTETFLSVIATGKDEVLGAEGNISDIVETLKSTSGDAEKQVQAIKASSASLIDDFKGIADNPIGFVKILAQYGIGKASGTAKNLIAGLFAQSLMEDHIEAGGTITDANQYLVSLGVKDGLGGMSFLASEIFGGDDNTDINLVVVYRVNIFPLLGDYTIPVAQSASTRAWLYGDTERTVKLPE